MVHECIQYFWAEACSSTQSTMQQTLSDWHLQCNYGERARLFSEVPDTERCRNWSTVHLSARRKDAEFLAWCRSLYTWWCLGETFISDQSKNILFHSFAWLFRVFVASAMPTRAQKMGPCCPARLHPELTAECILLIWANGNNWFDFDSVAQNFKLCVYDQFFPFFLEVNMSCATHVPETSRASITCVTFLNMVSWSMVPETGAGTFLERMRYFSLRTKYT